MEIFLGAEIEGPAAGKWFVLQKEFSRSLLSIEDRCYGDDLLSIGVISIVMRDKYFEQGGYKERLYYNKKNKEADIRLRINYNRFIKCNYDERREMYIDHILRSIQIAGKKAGDTFDLNRLLFDVENLLRVEKIGDG